jgi:hypothetical protein
MNIIKTSTYEGDHTCPICLVEFRENDHLCLIKHDGEKIAQARKHKHMFHQHCIQTHIDTCHSKDPDVVPTCPLDRQTIAKLVNIKYSELVALNIINYADNYYQLLGKLCHVSFVDHINLNYKDVNGKTLIYCACQRGETKLVRKLIKMGAQPTISDDSGFTPLMAAITNGHLEVVRVLLRHQSVIHQINHTDNKGLCAMDYAVKSEAHEIVSMLLNLSNIDQSTLKSLHQHYQVVKSTHLTIHDIKNRLCTLLNLPKLPYKIISSAHYPMSQAMIRSEQKTLNIDAQRHSQLYYHVYAPDIRLGAATPGSLEISDLEVGYTDQELRELAEFCET